MPFCLLPSLYATASSRQKVAGVIGIFSAGLICLLCTLGRIITGILHKEDPVIAVWNSAEQASIIIVICCMPLKWAWESKVKQHMRMPKMHIRKRSTTTDIGTTIVTKEKFEPSSAQTVGTTWDEETGVMWTVEGTVDTETSVRGLGHRRFSLMPKVKSPRPISNLIQKNGQESTNTSNSNDSSQTKRKGNKSNFGSNNRTDFSTTTFGGAKF